MSTNILTVFHIKEIPQTTTGCVSKLKLISLEKKISRKILTAVYVFTVHWTRKEILLFCKYSSKYFDHFIFFIV